MFVHKGQFAFLIEVLTLEAWELQLVCTYS